MRTFILALLGLMLLGIGAALIATGGILFRLRRR